MISCYDFGYFKFLEMSLRNFMLSIFQVRTIFLDGLPATWDEDRVRDYLKKFGRIEKIELARNMPAAKRTDFGFVTFDTHDSAVACVDSINNSELVDGERLVSCCGSMLALLFVY